TDFSCCLIVNDSILYVETMLRDLILTSYSYEHGSVLNPFGCLLSHTLDCRPCFPRNNAALRWPAEGNSRAHRDRHWRGGLESMVLSPASNERWRRATHYPRGSVRRYSFFA